MKIRPLIFATICGLSFLSVSCSGETSSLFGSGSGSGSGSGGSGSGGGGSVTTEPISTPYRDCLENARARSGAAREGAEIACENLI